MAEFPVTDSDEEKPKSYKDDKKLLTRVRKRTQLMIEADRENRKDAQEDMRFLQVPGAQWDPKTKTSRGTRPCYEFNKTRIKAKRIINEMRANRPAGKVRAVEDSDKPTADALEGMCRNITNVSDLDTITDYAAEYQVGGGMGAWRVDTDWADDTFNQEIRVNMIVNPFCLYADPASKDPLKRDAKDWSLIDRLDKTTYEAKYGKKARKIDFSADVFDDSSEWIDTETVRICEYWYQEPIEKELWLLKTGQTVDAADPKSAQITPDQIEKKRTADSVKWMMCIASGDAILEGPTEVKGKYAAFVIVYGEWVIIDGKPLWFGLTRNAKDAQRSYNVSRTAVTETIASAPNSHFWATAEQAKGNTDLWNKALSENLPYLLYNPDPKAGGPPTRMGSADIPAALIQEMQIADQELKDVTGVYDASLGERSNEQSGVAISRRSEQTQIVNFNFPDNMSKGIKRTWEIIIDRIPYYIDTEQTVRILGRDGAEEYIKVNEAGTDPKTGEPVILNDLSRGKYDVAVTVGPSFTTQRQEAAETYGQMAQGNPQLMTVAGDLIFKSMDLPYAEEIAERLQAILPPPIQQMLGQGKNVPPEVQQVMAQAQQAMAQVQQHGQLVQKAAAELDTKSAEVESSMADLSVKRAQFDADVAKSLANITMQEAALVLEQAKAQAGQATQSTDTLRETLQLDVQNALTSIQQSSAQYLQQALESLAQIHASSQPQVIMAPSPPKPRITRISRVNGALVPEYEAPTDSPVQQSLTPAMQ
ncbi:MAG TPA: portal protein [Nitrospiraceae bacterium]|nr:portal protein [Nitrospiraceae bacterium]